MNVRQADEKPGRYDFSAIEAKWQRYWEEHETFRAVNPDPAQVRSPTLESVGHRGKFYILDMFPYPSGAGLHVGHPLGYCATDIVARYKRMRGFNVLRPMGFDSFGLPAEQYAIETNVHPAVTTTRNIERYRRQLKMFGFSYDWSRELSTSEPGYYKFTQWMFLRMYESWYDDECQAVGSDGVPVSGRARPIAELVAELENGRWGVDQVLNIVRESLSLPGRGQGEGRKSVQHPSPDLSPRGERSLRREWRDLTVHEQREVINRQRLAYLDEVSVNWCPALGTVLSNEEVDNEGRSERGGHRVFRRPLRQWMLRITKYAERLINDLEELDWPEAIKLMQRNWVGRSTGAEVVFPLDQATKPRRQAGLPGHEATEGADEIRVYTTRPDTLFGATYMVLAPEHPLVERITTPEHRAAVETYVLAARNRSDLDRTADTKEKNGVFTGAYAINPVTGTSIPVWVADYVLMGYGTGAIMAVPGGDTRDFEFAVKFDLPIVAVVRPPAEWVEERVAAMTRPLEDIAASGFSEVERQFPEFAEEIAEHRAQSVGLSDKTVEVLHRRVGVERLIDHYIRQPQAWGTAYTGEGTAVNSPAEPPLSLPGRGQGEGNKKELLKSPGAPGLNSSGTPSCDLNGLLTPQAKAKIIAWLEENNLGRATVNYRLRDWIFSRQKYWGEPFPVLHGEDGETVALRDDELPLELPEMEDFKPTPVADEAHSLPEPPLGRATEWCHVKRGGKHYRRDLNTMPNWAGSCWYYLRFLDPHNSNLFCDPAAEHYWMPVDLYVGGAEHAVLHLLYARFWHKVLYDLDYVSTREPFHKLFNQGMIQGFAYRDRRGLVVGPDMVLERGEDDYVLRESGEPVTRIVAKMSKSLKNVVNPDEIIAEYGADTFRLYEMYMGPLDAAKPWNTRDVPGLFKLCQRVWRLVVDENTGGPSTALTDSAPDAEALRALHKTIKRVTEDIEQLKLNTAIAALFDFVNFLTPLPARPRAVVEPFVLLVSPFAPHLGEELWERLGYKSSLAYEPWPAYDPNLARDQEVEVGVQIAGKIKARLMVPADADERSIEAAALADERVIAALAGKTVRKVIVVKGRLVNIVTG